MAGNIPTYNSQVPNQTALPETRASAADFGAQIGQAMEGLGGGIEGLSAAMRLHQQQQQGVDGDLALAKLHQDTTALRIGMENSPDAGSPDFTKNFNDKYQELYQKAYDGLPANDKVRNAFKVGAATMFTGQVDQAVQSQATQGAALQTQKAQQTLSTYVNTIQTDPAQYAASVKLGEAAIAGLSLPPTATNQLLQQFRDDAVAGRFDALFRAAKSPDAVDGIIHDLETGPWKKQISDQQFGNLEKLAKSAKSSAQTIINQQASAAVSDVEDRIKGGVAVDPAEIATIGNAVKASNNPILLDKWVRLQVTNDTTQKVKGMSSAGLHDYVAANRGAAPLAHTTVTARVQDGFQYLKSKYGLSDTDAIGVLANVGREVGFNPRPGDGGTSDGYFQWHLDRLDRARSAGATGTDLRKAIDFAMSEPEGQAFLSRKGTFNSPSAAAQAWMEVFEKPKYPERDQPINEEWANRVVRAVNGGRPMIDIAPGSEDQANGYPSEAEYVRAKAAQDVLDRRNKLVGQGDQITAGQEAGLYTLGALNGPDDFRARAQQSVVATGFVGESVNKPFTPDEVAAFQTIMNSGTIDQKLGLLQNVSSMGQTVAPAAFKQIGEKAPLFSAVGGLNSISPTVARDVLRGAQAMQDNPDVKEGLTDAITGPGPGGTATVFNSVVGNAFANTPQMAYASRLAADALYVQRAGPGAAWDADTYTQAVRDVIGAKPGDAAGGVAEVNGQQTALPPGVTGDEFETMVGKLTAGDLVSHSVGGSPPHYVSGELVKPQDISNEGHFSAVTAGVYNVIMADGKPLLGSGTNGFYEFKIDANGVDNIVQRPEDEQRAQGASLYTDVIDLAITPMPEITIPRTPAQKAQDQQPSGFSQLPAGVRDFITRIPSRSDLRDALQLKVK